MRYISTWTPTRNDVSLKRFLPTLSWRVRLHSLTSKPSDPHWSCFSIIGHYKALEWSEQEQKYIENPNLGILVEVDVCVPQANLNLSLTMNYVRNWQQDTASSGHEALMIVALLSPHTKQAIILFVYPARLKLAGAQLHTFACTSTLL